MRWDPQQYARYADERSRPFVDLVARIGAERPRRVVDLGCGPGPLTALLAQRWPDAVVEGVDSSPEMIERAAPLATGLLRFRVGCAEDWTMPADADVLVSNALLQWVPTHRSLLRAWAAALPSGGWLAAQMPRNFDSPSHTEIRALAESPPWTERLAGVLRHEDVVDPPPDYVDLLHGAGLDADVWETTYLHVLLGRDPVLDWVRGTALRPVFAALSDREAEAFVADLAPRLRAAYPPGPGGTVLPFRRIFAVGRKL